MALTVFWTQFAKDKLEDIFEYYRLKAGARIAKNLVNSIVDATIDLENHPLRGTLEELLRHKPQEFRFLICKNYKIIYWINKEENRIDISNVFDTRQNPSKIKSIK